MYKRQVQERAKLKTSISRLVNILFPELEKLVPSLHMVSIYALLAEFPSSAQIASCHLTRLTNLLANASKGHYNKEKAIEIRNAAKPVSYTHLDVYKRQVMRHFSLKSYLMNHPTSLHVLFELFLMLSEFAPLHKEVLNSMITVPFGLYRFHFLLLLS